MLEPLRPGHAAALFAVLQDPRLYRFIPTVPPASLQALKARYRLLAKRRSPDGKEIWLNWALRLSSRGAYVGWLQATLGRGPALIAYTVFPRFWRRGFAVEGCRAMLRELFETHELGRVAAEMDTRNEASIRLVESLGFKRVGVKKGADFFKGASSDEYRYQLSRRDWAGTAGPNATPAGGARPGIPRRKSRRTLSGS